MSCKIISQVKEMYLADFYRIIQLQGAFAVSQKVWRAMGTS